MFIWYIDCRCVISFAENINEARKIVEKTDNRNLYNFISSKEPNKITDLPASIICNNLYIL